MPLPLKKLLVIKPPMGSCEPTENKVPAASMKTSFFSTFLSIIFDLAVKDFCI